MKRESCTLPVSSQIEVGAFRFGRALVLLSTGQLLLSCFFFHHELKLIFAAFVELVETRRWEQWHLRVVVNNTPRPVSDDSAAVIERQRIQVCG
jgi:hypothetical protein